MRLVVVVVGGAKQCTLAWGDRQHKRSHQKIIIIRRRQMAVVDRSKVWHVWCDRIYQGRLFFQVKGSEQSVLGMN